MRIFALPGLLCIHLYLIFYLYIWRLSMFYTLITYQTPVTHPSQINTTVLSENELSLFCIKNNILSSYYKPFPITINRNDNVKWVIIENQ